MKHPARQLLLLLAVIGWIETATACGSKGTRMEADQVPLFLIHMQDTCGHSDNAPALSFPQPTSIGRSHRQHCNFGLIDLFIVLTLQ